MIVIIIIFGVLFVTSFTYILDKAFNEPDTIKIYPCIRCKLPTFYEYHSCSRCHRIDRERLSGLESKKTMRQSDPSDERGGVSRND